jgi:hypothetical protein
MKGILPWLVRWARPVGAIVFCPAMSALVYPVQKLFSSPHTFSLPHRQATWAGSRAGSSVSESLSYLFPLLNLSAG